MKRIINVDFSFYLRRCSNYWPGASSWRGGYVVRNQGKSHGSNGTAQW